MKPLARCANEGPAATARRTWCGTLAWSDCKQAVWGWWWGHGVVRRAIFKRDGFRCQACGIEAPTIEVRGVRVPNISTLHMDHVVPLARGGANAWDNFQTLCAPCNLRKGARLTVPEAGG